MNSAFFFPGFAPGMGIPTSPRSLSDSDDMFGVFVGDLPQDANEQDLIKLFTVANLPVVKCKIIRDMDNNSKRYGFVHFPTEDLRQKAIIEMHGASLKGQTINVRTQHYKETDRCLVKTGTKKTDIYIGNIPRTLSKYQVREAISDWELPKVQDVKVFKNDTGMFCFISFLTEAEVTSVMEQLKNNPKTLAGRELLVQSSGISITSTLNAEILRNPNFATTPEEQQIIQALAVLRQALGGDACPLNDRQLALLEKSQRTLYVRNLHPNTSESALNQKFNKYGKLRKVIIVADKDTKVPMGYGFVEFYSSQATSRAAMDDDCELDGQLLTLQVSRPPKDIHGILTAAGKSHILTGISSMTESGGNIGGNLLTNYGGLVQNQQTAYYQDPSTGQLFVGDASAAQTLGYMPQQLMNGLGGGLMVQQPLLQQALQPQLILPQQILTHPQLMLQQQQPLQQLLQLQQMQLQAQQQASRMQQRLQTSQLQQLQSQNQLQTKLSPKSPISSEGEPATSPTSTLPDVLTTPLQPPSLDKLATPLTQPLAQVLQPAQSQSVETQTPNVIQKNTARFNPY